jgi:NADP-dependent 3-hydroxy acid dehydrogenase YdfG
MKKEKIVFITGATSGIGLATAKSLLDLGCRIIACGRRADRLEQLKAEHPDLVHTLQFDVRDSKAVFAAVESLPAAWSEVDVLINNAGNAFGLSEFHEAEIADWDLMIDTNVKGLLYVSRALMPTLIKTKGHVINVSSIAGKWVYEKAAVYCASKKAVEAITEGMRLDLTKYGVKVSSVAPGMVETEFSLVRFGGNAERAKKTYADFDPLQAQDIAEAIKQIIEAPEHVNYADMVIFPKYQASTSSLYRKSQLKS